MMEFRVKFYASDLGNLQHELTRYLFFKQVKKDLLENRYGDAEQRINEFRYKSSLILSPLPSLP